MANGEQWVRSKQDQLVIRVAEHTKAAFQDAATRIADGVGAADGSKLSQSNIFEYFMAWLAELPYAEQTNHIRAMRRVFQDVQERRELEIARAASPQPPPESAPHTVGGHTRGERVGIDDVMKPVKAGPKRRPDRKKMSPVIDR